MGNVVLVVTLPPVLPNVAAVTVVVVVVDEVVVNKLQKSLGASIIDT